METNNKKVIDKEYLEDAFYLYNENFVKGKQDNLTPDNYISIEDSKIGLNIESEGNDGDYLTKSGDKLEWNTPITGETVNSEESEENSFITLEALKKFNGSDNISKVGEITSGSWNGGEIIADDITSKTLLKFTVGNGNILTSEDANITSKLTIGDASNNGVVNVNGTANINGDIVTSGTSTANNEVVNTKLTVGDKKNLSSDDVVIETIGNIESSNNITAKASITVGWSKDDGSENNGSIIVHGLEGTIKVSIVDANKLMIDGKTYVFSSEPSEEKLKSFEAELSEIL